MVSVITSVIGLLVAGLIILLIRKDRLHVTHGMGWILVAAGFALLGFAPKIIDQMANYLGVDYPPVLALTLAISLLVVKILLMDIQQSHLALRNQRLVQRIGMLETDLKHLQGDVPGDASAAATPHCREKTSQENT